MLRCRMALNVESTFDLTGLMTCRQVECLTHMSDCQLQWLYADTYAAWA
jgi:hypothetical protein